MVGVTTSSCFRCLPLHFHRHQLRSRRHGTLLASAGLADDVIAAASIFAQSEPAEANRLANAMDWRGKSVLMHAASRDFPKIVKLLLQNKARPDASDYSAGGVTALMLAARNGSVAAAEALVAGGASVHATTPAGTSVLMHAVANGDLDRTQQPDAPLDILAQQIVATCEEDCVRSAGCACALALA